MGEADEVSTGFIRGQYIRGRAAVLSRRHHHPRQALTVSTIAWRSLSMIVHYIGCTGRRMRSALYDRVAQSNGEDALYCDIGMV